MDGNGGSHGLCFPGRTSDSLKFSRSLETLFLIQCLREHRETSIDEEVKLITSLMPLTRKGKLVSLALTILHPVSGGCPSGDFSRSLLGFEFYASD